jgi:hypothetical protein
MKVKGEITPAQAEDYLKVIKERQDSLKEKSELLIGTIPYVAYGVFLDRGTSEYSRLNIVMHGKAEKLENGSVIKHTVTLL